MKKVFFSLALLFSSMASAHSVDAINLGGMIIPQEAHNTACRIMNNPNYSVEDVLYILNETEAPVWSPRFGTFMSLTVDALDGQCYGAGAI